MADYTLYYISSAAFLIIIVLIYQLIQWDKNLKNLVDAKLSNHISEIQSPNAPTPAKKLMQSSVAAFIVIMLIVFGTFAYAYIYYEKYEHLQWLNIIQIVLLCFSLLGGFLLGSMRRSVEANHFLNEMLSQHKQREWVERKLSLSEARLIKQQQALATLAQNPDRKKHEASDIFKEYTQITAETLNVERVSIWLNTADNTALECADFYTKSNNTHQVLAPVAISEIPHYFLELNKHRVIAADDALQHPALQELTDGYLQDNNIGAVLDGGIWQDGHAAGVVCIEHVGGVRKWASDELTFAGAIADLVRVTIETCKRRIAEQALLERSTQLEQMVQARTLSLRESDKRFNYVVQEAPIAILMIDRNGHIIELNDEAVNASGYSREQLLGKHFIKTMVAKESRAQAKIMAARALQGENFKHVELLLQNAAGEKYEYECSVGMTVKNTNNGSGHMVAIAQNISQQRALQKSLIKAREAAESADRTKSMFVASMSHELRTPLNSIIGFIGVVLQGISGELNPTQKDQLHRAYQSSQHLLLLISDVLDVSKIEAGFLQLNIEKFELKPLLIELEHAVQHLLAGKDLSLGIVCTAKLQVTTDRKCLYQVLLNLLSNAVKYTEQGSIQMKAHIEGHQLIVSCNDTGIGINEADFPSLFQPFVRVESFLKIKTPGTGLGLYLTHKILTQLLGGSIAVHSEIGQGSTFTIIIPANKSARLASKVASDVKPKLEDAVL